jgi:hypothetical protein
MTIIGNENVILIQCSAATFADFFNYILARVQSNFHNIFVCILTLQNVLIFSVSIQRQ